MQQRKMASPVAVIGVLLAASFVLSANEVALSKDDPLSLQTPPLPASLMLPGKKGVCRTLRDPRKSKKGTWKQNIAKVRALRGYWNYSWGMRLVPVQPADMEFVPMAWHARSAKGLKRSLRQHVVPQIEAGRVKRMLGFNEPDKKDQANMPYEQAIKYWPILESLNVPLCSPACANTEGINDDSVQGVPGTWMRDFMTEADKRGYRVDYIGVHWYGGTSAANFKKKMIRIYKKYGKRPLLITEFAPADWKAKTPEQNRHKPARVLAFMKDVLPWMHEQNWIAGYAWFSFSPDSRAGHSSALFDREGNLTACGRFYASVTNENPSGDQSIQVE